MYQPLSDSLTRNKTQLFKKTHTPFLFPMHSENASKQQSMRNVMSYKRLFKSPTCNKMRVTRTLI